MSDEIVSVFEKHRTEASVIFPVPAVKDGDREMLIYVEKAGGGSPDRQHTGQWLCELRVAGKILDSTDQIDIPLPMSPWEVSGQYAELLAAYGDEHSGTGGYGKYIKHLEPHSERLYEHHRQVQFDSDGYER